MYNGNIVNKKLVYDITDKCFQNVNVIFLNEKCK